jgi:DNA-binding beta-propeller fold protein YncE
MGNKGILVIDLVRNAISTTIQTLAYRLAIHPLGTFLYGIFSSAVYADNNSNKVSVIDLSNNNQVSFITVGSNCAPCDIVIDTKIQCLYTINSDETLSIISISPTNTLIGTYSVKPSDFNVFGVSPYYRLIVDSSNIYVLTSVLFSESFTDIGFRVINKSSLPDPFIEVYSSINSIELGESCFSNILYMDNVNVAYITLGQNVYQTSLPLNVE